MPYRSKISKTFFKLHKLKKPSDFYVMDVETWGLNATPDHFALGVIYGKDFIFRTTDVKEMRKKLLSPMFKHRIIFAHNAIYDLMTIFGNIIKNLDRKTIFNGGAFILSKYDNRTFADSFNILPTKLATIGELLKFPKGETPEKFILGTKTTIEEQDFLYCEQDCKIVHKALENVFNEIGCVRVTLASLSMALFRRKFLPETLYYSDLNYTFFDSYYGGRVECFRIGKVYAQKFDVNSMYPNAMKNALFPNPAKMTLIKEATPEKALFYISYYEGMMKCTVRHKESYIGFLPYRLDKGKLIFPVGTFTGSWNFNELRFALKHKIIEIIDVEHIIYAPRQKSIFTKFVDTLYEQRMKEPNEFRKYFLKIILNSLYGKFAQRKKSQTTYIKDMTAHHFKLKEGMKIVPFNMERNDAFIVTEDEGYSYNTIPSYSSYITSYARVHLLELFLEYIENDPVYMDTDSIAFNNYTKEVKTGKGLGMFKMEPKIITYIYGNKSYEEKDGTLVLKGIKKGATRLKNNVFTTTRIIKPKAALRRNIRAGTSITETKVLNFSEYDKRQIEIDGTSAPIRIDPNV